MLAREEREPQGRSWTPSRHLPRARGGNGSSRGTTRRELEQSWNSLRFRAAAVLVARTRGSELTSIIASIYTKGAGSSTAARRGSHRSGPLQRPGRTDRAPTNGEREPAPYLFPSDGSDHQKKEGSPLSLPATGSPRPGALHPSTAAPARKAPRAPRSAGARSASMPCRLDSSRSRDSCRREAPRLGGERTAPRSVRPSWG